VGGGAATPLQQLAGFGKQELEWLAAAETSRKVNTSGIIYRI